MRPRKITDEKLASKEEKILPLSECVANLKAIGLDDQEIDRLGETLDAIIDHQLDEIFNQYN